MNLEAEIAWHAAIRVYGHIFTRPSSGRGPRVCARCKQDQRAAEDQQCEGRTP
jgi:hypothetical protein